MGGHVDTPNSDPPVNPAAVSKLLWWSDLTWSDLTGTGSQCQELLQSQQNMCSSLLPGTHEDTHPSRRIVSAFYLKLSMWPKWNHREKDSVWIIFSSAHFFLSKLQICHLYRFLIQLSLAPANWKLLVRVKVQDKYCLLAAQPHLSLSWQSA